MTPTLAGVTEPRIAMLLASLGRGGTETQALSLARGLAESGCHVDVFVMYGDRPVLRHSQEDWPVTQLLHFGGEDHSGGIPGDTSVTFSGVELCSAWYCSAL